MVTLNHLDGRIFVGELSRISMVNNIVFFGLDIPVLEISMAQCSFNKPLTQINQTIPRGNKKKQNNTGDALPT